MSIGRLLDRLTLYVYAEGVAGLPALSAWQKQQKELVLHSLIW